MVQYLNYTKSLIIIALATLVWAGCVTKKKKTEVSAMKKFYHNVTSEYNGYFNANELMIFALEDLKRASIDNYAEILELYDYVSVPDAKIVNADMDKAIEKVTRVAKLHEPGDWVDDCYVLMGKAQYLKQDYQTAVETLQFFEEDFNPANPYGRNFQKRKLSSREIAKQRKKEKKAKEKEKKELQKAREEEREKAKESKAEEREALIKKREADKKEREKAKKKASKSKERPPRTPKTDTPASTTTTSTPAPINKPEVAEEETSDATPPPSITKKDKDDTAYNEGLVWLAKSFIRAQQYTSAEFLLNRLEKIESLNPEVRKELLVAQADLMVKTNRKGKALEYIDAAIDSKASREEKGRYNFVAGQILMENGEYRSAKNYFSAAAKKTKDNKMKFMSELNSIKCDYIGSNKDQSEFASKLKKMLKETKYEEFRDQIHFAYGDIAASNGDIPTAKEQYSLSVANNNGDKSLLGEAYFRLAEINLSIEDYVNAKNYYDSTLAVISKTDVRYSQVSNYSTNLSTIASNLTAIAKIDSSLAMSGMSEKELYNIAKKRLEAEKASGKTTDKKPSSGLVKNPSSSKAIVSDYWAYNSNSVRQGMLQFQNTWGNIPLTDNWRISSKVNSSLSADITTNNTTTVDSSLVTEVSKEDFDRVMSDVPTSALDKVKLMDERTKLSVSLGKAFRDKIQKYQKSIDVLEPLELRVSPYYDVAEVYYYIYLDYQDLGNRVEMKKYKDILAEKYPENKYSKLINEDGYAETLASESKKLDRYYDQTFNAFQKGEYDQVVKMVENAKQTFGTDNKLVAKFSLLNAMALGYSQGQQAYIDALNEVITRYPKTPEETKAKEIKRFLQGDSNAFKNVNSDEAKSLFSVNDDARHYVAVIIFDKTDEALQTAKTSISEYNKKYFGPDRLQMSDLILNQTDNQQLVLIRHFANKEKAMAYFNSVMKTPEEFIPTSLTTFELYPITQENYRKVIQERSHLKYRTFFETTYLGQ